MKDEYVHPNFLPADETKYLELISRLRTEGLDDSIEFIYVSKEEYGILEDAAHQTMKGKGHSVYGKEVKIN